VQWIADQQLAACRDRARRRALVVGLYLDVAVGFARTASTPGATKFHPAGDRDRRATGPAQHTRPALGLAGFNPVDLVNRDCEPFRRVLAASMCYAGAIRLDHVLGSAPLPHSERRAGRPGRLYPFPFEALLAAIAQESVANQCIVIGEDLGTVLENFSRDARRRRALVLSGDAVRARRRRRLHLADLYRENALVTFATHDLSTFAGWRAAMISPSSARSASTPVRATMTALPPRRHWHGRWPGAGLQRLSFPRSRNPGRHAVAPPGGVDGRCARSHRAGEYSGTIDEHPNWRRRLPSTWKIGAARWLAAVAKVMVAPGGNGQRVGRP